MDRVEFLIDGTTERPNALLNPETIRVRRRSGLRVLEERPGTIAGAGGSDDTLIATSGGRTEIELDLVFEVEMALDQPRPTDVRDITGLFWRLSENTQGGQPQPFRMIWGKRWNVPLVIESVSERFDRFDREGNPLRSWLSIRALRTAEPEELPPSSTLEPIDPFETTPRAPSAAVAGETSYMVVAGSDEGQARVDTLGAELGGRPSFWRILADQVDPDRLPWIDAGTLLRAGGVALSQLGDRMFAAGSESTIE